MGVPTHALGYHWMHYMMNGRLKDGCTRDTHLVDNHLTKHARGTPAVQQSRSKMASFLEPCRALIATTPIQKKTNAPQQT